MFNKEFLRNLKEAENSLKQTKEFKKSEAVTKPISYLILKCNSTFKTA